MISIKDILASILILLVGVAIGLNINVDFVTDDIENQCNEYLLANCIDYKLQFQMGNERIIDFEDSFERNNVTKLW